MFIKLSVFQDLTHNSCKTYDTVKLKKPYLAFVNTTGLDILYVVSKGLVQALDEDSS